MHLALHLTHSQLGPLNDCYLPGLLTIIMTLSSQQGTAQAEMGKPRYTVEAGTYLATVSTNPFWVRSNQYGEVPLNSPGFTFRAQVKKEYDTLANKKLSYGYGVRAVLNAGAINQLLLSEVYGKIRYGAIELYAGRRREIAGLVDSVLSAGSYIWSGNALPMPKLQIAIPQYTPILKNGLIAIKGNYAHGWFGTGDSVSNYFLHQKSIYIRLGKPHWRIKIHGGFNHQVQWGGTVLYPRYDSGVRITQFGTDLSTYWYVISGKTLYTADPLIIQNGQASAEGGNRVGNHLGTLDLGFEYEDDRNRWFLYRQSIYEAGALYNLSNISDGLTGLSISRRHIKQGIQRIMLEYLHTSSQGGPIASGRATISETRGYEDYFNNGRYIDGWAYKGQTIGTPFIMPLQYTTGLPQNLVKNPHYIVNNRVNAITLGVKSRYRQFDLLTRLSFSENMGSYDIPLSYTQTSIQQQIMFPVKAYFVTANIGYDAAGVLKPNIGINLLVSRTF